MKISKFTSAIYNTFVFKSALLQVLYASAFIIFLFLSSLQVCDTNNIPFEFFSIQLGTCYDLSLKDRTKDNSCIK